MFGLGVAIAASAIAQGMMGGNGQGMVGGGMIDVDGMMGEGVQSTVVRHDGSLYDVRRRGRGMMCPMMEGVIPKVITT